MRFVDWKRRRQFKFAVSRSDADEHGSRPALDFGSLRNRTGDDGEPPNESPTDIPDAGAELRSEAFKGGRWGAAESITAQVLTLATTAVLARILTPEDFGLVAIATVVVGLLSLVTEAGFTPTIIRRIQIDREVSSTTFWAALSLGFTASVLAVLLSNPLAVAFGDGTAAPLISVAAWTLVLGMAASVPKGLLLRDYRYGAVSLIAVAGLAVYGLTAVLLAAMFDIGAWAIVVGKVTAAVVDTASSLAAARWRPSLVFRRSVLRQDLAFNIGFLGNRLVGYGSKNLDYWAVGRTLGSGTLGSYYVAYIAPNLVRQRMTWIAQRALLPVFSRMIDDPARLVRAYLAVYQFTALVALPMLLGLALVADGAVLLVFGPSWTEAARPMAILAAAASVEALHPVNATLFVSQGRPSLNLIVNVVRVLTLGIGLALASEAGTLVAFALAVLASTLAAVFTSQLIVFRRVPLDVTAVAKALLPAIVPVAAMCAAVWGFRSLAFIEDLDLRLQAILSVPVGGTIYFALGFGLFPEAFRNLMRDIRKTVMG